jgi:predicted transcriptional regulator
MAAQRMYFLYKVERGRAQAEVGETISHEEAKHHLHQRRA